VRGGGNERRLEEKGKGEAKKGVGTGGKAMWGRRRHGTGQGERTPVNKKEG